MDDELRESPPESAEVAVPRAPAAAGPKWALDFAPGVMEEIARAVELGSPEFAHGGVEIRGILFGSLQRRSIVIESWAPFACEQPCGAQLSETDSAKLLGVIGSSAANPSRSGTPVGWMVSHTSGEMTPALPEVELFHEFFPQPWQVLLVVSPMPGRTAQAAFYLRDAGGVLNTARPYRGLVIRPDGNAPSAAASETRPAADTSAAAPEAEPAPPEEGARRRSPWRWLWLAVPALAVLAAVVTAVLWLRPAPPPEETPDLAIIDVNHEMVIRWTTPVSIVRDAVRGELSIRDGADEKTVPLVKSDLRHGSLTWARHGNDMRVNLRIWHGSRQANAVAQYFGPPVADVTAAPPPQNDEVDRLKSENQRLRGELDQANARATESENAVRILRNRLKIEQPNASTQTTH